MSEPSIPVALGPQGNVVPIEEAERFKTDYYRCKECGEILNPRKGSKRTHYYAHKRGALTDKTCSLSSQADIEELVDELRTSDIEKDESNRRIRTFLGEAPGGRVRFFGILPTLDWGEIPPSMDVDQLLEEMTIETEGVTNPPTPKNFHPSEPEVLFEIDPETEEVTVNIEGDEWLDSLAGRWTVEGLTDGTLFTGDQSRARRRQGNQQIKQGEWVYLVTTETPKSLPDVVQTHSLGSFTVLAFPAREETKDLLDAYGDGLTADQYGFDADVILPSAAHPTAEAPTDGKAKQAVLVSVTPSPEIDPTFEVVSIPRRAGDVVEIEPTGPGNPRYFRTHFPLDGSQRISIHQRNSNRHRLVHLHSADEDDPDTGGEISTGIIGLQLELDEEILLTPFNGESRAVISDQAMIASLPARVSYVGPQGLEIEIIARFAPGSPHGSLVRRTTTEIERVVPEISQWALQGCQEVSFNFDGLGTVQIEFDQTSDTGSNDVNRGPRSGGSL